MATLTQSQAQPGTFAAMRYPSFRLFFSGQLISLAGSWMQIVAQGWLVYHLTQSELWLGVVACAAGIPSLFLSPLAGVWVDRISRRTLLLWTQVGFMLLAFTLALLTFSDAVEVWQVAALAVFTGIVSAVDAPARLAFVKDMVGPELISSGVALNSLIFNGARIIGPLVAAVLLAQFGPAWCFLINGVSYTVVITTLSLMHLDSAVRPPGGASPLKALREGVAFSRRHAVILPILLLATTTCVFLINVMTMLPAFAAEVLNAPINGLSILTTSQGIGAIFAALLMNPLARKYGRGRGLAWVTFLMCGSALALTTTTHMAAAALCMSVFGFSTILFFTSCNILIQNQSPDAVRGRVLSLYTVTWLGLSPFGALALGFIADDIGTPLALALYALANGLLCALILLRWPGVRNAR